MAAFWSLFGLYLDIKADTLEQQYSLIRVAAQVAFHGDSKPEKALRKQLAEMRSRDSSPKKGLAEFLTDLGVSSGGGF
jgi:hypothetical protein